jgi:hypothetical protein
MVHIVGDPFLPGGVDLGRQAADAAGEDDDGNTVAQAFLGDLVAEPHREHGARKEHRDDIGIGPEGRAEIEFDIARCSPSS